MLPGIAMITNKSSKASDIFCTQLNDQTVLFDPQIGPFQVLPLRARVDLGVMAIKRYSTFPKAPALLEPHHQIV